MQSGLATGNIKLPASFLVNLYLFSRLTRVKVVNCFPAVITGKQQTMV